MLECVINLSEGRRPDVVELIARNAGAELLDVHFDADHHRCVVTVVGEAAARAVATAAVLALDLRSHRGAHPRFGVVDVVPFVPLGSASLDDAMAARDAFARSLAEHLGVPCFLYGPERSLPELRRRAFADLEPDFGPREPHLTAGAAAVGARHVLVAYNVWLAEPDLDRARQIAAQLRSPSVRALGLAVGQQVQVSMNLIAPLTVGPAEVYDAIAARATIDRAELVGLIPDSLLTRTPIARWHDLDLGADRTIEARLATRGFQID
jgi:glutamate formiminotransferase